MNSLNEETEINTAFMQGLISLAAVFYVLKDQISEKNIEVFVSLVVLFVILSLIRVFGVILKVELLKHLSFEIFVLVCVPWTLFVASRIILTQIFQEETVKNAIIASITPFYIFIFVMAYMVLWHYDLKITFRSPIKIIKGKRKGKEHSAKTATSPAIGGEPELKTCPKCSGNGNLKCEASGCVEGYITEKDGTKKKCPDCKGNKPICHWCKGIGKIKLP